MLKAVVHVFDVARHNNCQPSTKQRLKDRYKATATVKNRRRSGQPRISTAVKTALTLIIYRRYLHRRYPFQLATVSARRIAGLQA